jgi:hypothetical protein
MADTQSENAKASIGAQVIHEVTQPARRNINTVEFAGFLIREDDDTIYIADRKGTWVVGRQDIVFLEDWKNAAMCAPDFMPNSGRPIRVAVREGATVHEIRPWLLKKEIGGFGGSDFRKALEKVFTLGGAPLPVSDRTMLGERQIAELERMFARRLGWDPNDPCTNPIAPDGGTVSKTITCYDEPDCKHGFTDTD